MHVFFLCVSRPVCLDI